MSKPLFYDVIDGTWPAAHIRSLGPWTLREGRGGGSRVSAATLAAPIGPVADADITQAQSAMRLMRQEPRFMVREAENALDRQLAARSYLLADPVVIHACPVQQLTDIAIPRITVFTIWEPLAIMAEIWASGGIGPARQAIMQRAKGPKTALLGRQNEKPAGAAFVAIHAGIAMVHAVEILPHQRRAGMGGWFMRAAAFWAAEQGAHTLSVMCTRANTGANALYASLGMDAVGHYHYRHLPTEPDPT
jgi:GNAT superfamily N-acetyltransferase